MKFPLKKVIDVSKEVDDNATKSDDIVLIVAKRRTDAVAKRTAKEKSANPRLGEKKKVTISKRKIVESEEPSLKRVEEPGSLIKKRKVEKELSKSKRINMLKTQKVLNGRVFDPEVLEKSGMRDLFDLVASQDWTHLFKWPVSTLYEAEVREFYYNMKCLKDGSLETKVHDVQIHLDGESLGHILNVSSERIRSVEKSSPTPHFIEEARKMPG